MKVINKLKHAVLLTAALSVFAGCESDAENAVEDVGEKIEETAEDTKDKIKDATN